MFPYSQLSQSGWRERLSNNWAKVIWTQKHWSRSNRVYTGLCQVFRINTVAFNLIILWGFWMCDQVGLWFLCPLLELFYFFLCLIFFFACLVQLQCDGNCFIFLCFILLCFISILIKACSFQSRERQEGSGSGEWGGGKELAGVEGRKAVVILYFIRKESLISQGQNV